MRNELFHLITVTRVLAEGVELTEALAFPEISALGTAERQWRKLIQTKAKSLLEDNETCPIGSLYRRRLNAKVEIDEVEVTLNPPPRSAEWQEPITVVLPFVRWEEELHHVYVPAMGILVFAPREGLLVERLRQHVRLLLVGKGRRLRLDRLARVARHQTLQLGTVDVTATIKTAKQIAASLQAVTAESSTLEQLAEELPPLVPRKSTPATDALPQKVDHRPALPTAFEMDAELQTLAEALSGSHPRSVLLVGRSGCGKSALVRELARRRRDFGFTHSAFWSTSGARLMTGPIGFGMWQERCQQLCREVGKSRAFLHVNNLAELLEVGKASPGQQSVGSFLRPWIARGEILVIAECTPEQLGPIELQDPHLLEVFQQLAIAERTPEQTRTALTRVFDGAPGKPPVDEGALTGPLNRLHELHLRYATYSANPGRPIRFLNNLLADRFPEKSFTEADVTAAFSRETGLPEVLLDDRIPLDPEATREWFSTRVIGQGQAITRVIDMLAMIKARLARPGKPLASFLFIGPTGTGKTELAKAVAEFLFGDVARLARFDLNEFSDPLAVQRLIGGLQTGEGLLTARVREQPFSVLLLDEFEKADTSFFDLLLQILGDGRLTDSAGRVADFSNSVIVMTSNLGAQGYGRGPSGFRSIEAATADALAHFVDAVKQFLRPEIFNRLDAIVPFQPLSPEVVLSIAQRQLELLQQRDGLRLRPVELCLAPGVTEHLARLGYDPKYGARPLKRTITHELLTPLAEALNRFSEALPVSVTVMVADSRVKVEIQASDTGQSAAAVEASVNDLPTSITALRRTIAKLKTCSTTTVIENRVTLLESLQRRLTIHKYRSPEQEAQLAQLPRLRRCLDDIAALHDEVKRLEIDVLAAFYARAPMKDAFVQPQFYKLQARQRQLLREVFTASQESPHDITLAFFSEHRATLLEFAAAYRAVAASTGQLIALDYFLPPPGARTTASKPSRETPKSIDQFFTNPPEKLIGVVLHLRGDLISPRFQPECGLHVTVEGKEERACLIEGHTGAFAEYEPPNKIDRPGTIKAKGARVCRRYLREKGTVEDSLLGERPWHGLGLDRCLIELIEERLNRVIESILS